RQLGVQVGGSLEGAVRLIVVEGVDEAQVLVEEFLGLGVLGGDGVVGGAETVEQDGGFLSGGGVLAERGGGKETKGEEGKTSHGWLLGRSPFSGARAASDATVVAVRM